MNVSSPLGWGRVVSDKIRIPIGGKQAAILLMLILSVSLGSCIYFNTMYNARKLYGVAEEMEAEAGGQESRAAEEKYKEVVIKCASVLQNHPESSWVDDAIFLMGKALVKQKEYAKGIRKFLELTTNFPESEYVPNSLYWLALANFEKRDYNQALLYTDRFINAFPEHELRYRVRFLAGDINLELGDDREALGYYSQVADEASKREIVEEAILKRAKLYFLFEDWNNAAESYGSLLKKGISWQMRYEISLSLGQCYTNIGRCTEALDLYTELLPDVPKLKDEGPVMLGQAASYVCMDSLSAAMRVYRTIGEKFPRSDFSAESYYRLGLLYHERLDSLQAAQVAFEKVANESSSSEFTPLARQKSTSIKKLIELQKASGDEVTGEQMAERRFMAAEIQLTRLAEIEPAISNYTAVIDSFPESSWAPKAAYAIGWIYQKEKADSARALEAYSGVITRYPRSLQARGALRQVFRLGTEQEALAMQAYIDSALADTAAAAAEMSRKLEADRADSLLIAQNQEDGGGMSAADSIRARSGRPGPPVPVDRDRVKKETRYRLDDQFRPAFLDSLRRARFEKLRRLMWGGVEKRSPVRNLQPPPGGNKNDNG